MCSSDLQNKDAAVSAAKELGFPLVLKACSREILHKSGKDLIFLDISSTAEAGRAFDLIQDAVRKAVPVPVLVGRMVKGKREFVAGIVNDDEFGPSVMFGLGGIFTETLNDAVFRPAPVSLDDAREMMREIRAEKLLGPVRGMPAVDIGALADILHKLSLIPLAHPEIREIDINPLIVEGNVPVAVDALVVLNRPD